MDSIVLSLGSNLGDRLANLERACQLLEEEYIRVLERSPVYETQPFGIVEQPLFLNQVVRVKTKLAPQFLLEKLLRLERSMGRVRREKNGPRIIDLDLLFYRDILSEDERLLLPHPGIPERRCILQPLVDILPDFRHPLLAKTVRQLLDECEDRLIVKPYFSHEH